MLKNWLGLSLSAILCFGFIFSVVADESPTLEDCDAKKLMTFFPVEFVNEALNKYKVPQSQWQGIIEELTQKDEEIIKRIEEKAAKLQSNPLDDPTQIAITFKIFRETLLEVFGGVLAGHGVQDPAKIADILQTIQDLKRKRFQACLDKGAIISPDELPKKQTGIRIQNPE